MNEIIKLYENAWIKPTKNWQSCLNCKLKTETRYDEWGEEYLTCKMLERPEKCFDAKEYYPPFTAEKQLELIKWLGKRCFYIEISEMGNKSYGIAFKYQPADEYKNEQSECFTNKNFAEALAESINYIWQDLTEEERQQIKEILK